SNQRAEWQSPADGFSKGRQIGCDAVERLGAAEPDTRPRDHFVEYQHRAVTRRELAQPLQERALRMDDATRDWLDYDGRDVLAPPQKRPPSVRGAAKAADERGGPT